MKEFRTVRNHRIRKDTLPIPFWIITASHRSPSSQWGLNVKARAWDWDSCPLNSVSICRENIFSTHQWRHKVGKLLLCWESALCAFPFVRTGKLCFGFSANFNHRETRQNPTFIYYNYIKQEESLRSLILAFLDFLFCSFFSLDMRVSKQEEAKRNIFHVFLVSLCVERESSHRSFSSLLLYAPHKNLYV